MSWESTTSRAVGRGQIPRISLFSRTVRKVKLSLAKIAAFGSTLVAAAVLAAGFLRNDFSLTYVADHSNRSLSGVYKLSALWGGQEGSLLLWLLILTGYAALAVWINRKRTRDLVVWVTPVLAGIRPAFG